MKTDREIFNDLAKRSKILYELTEKERKDLQQTLLSMLTDLINICERHQLTVLLVGGSALGAVRHQGFIPWDDDLDVGMARNDYDKLLSYLKNGELGDKYEYSTPDKERDSKNLYLKIFLKGSLYQEILDVNLPFPNGVFLDVFPIENAPAPSLSTRVRGLSVTLLQHISVSVLQYKYRSKEYKMFMSENTFELSRYYLRTFIGFCFSFISHKRWTYWADLAAQYHSNTDFCTIPTGTKRYNGEMMRRNLFFPVSKGVFEGIKVNLPHDVNAYLTNMYGNYMNIPPVEKRERHFIYNFKLPND